MHVWLCVYVCVCDAITAACCVAFHHLRGLPLMVRPWGEGGEEVVRKYELSKILGTFVQLPPKSEVGMFVMGYDK